MPDSAQKQACRSYFDQLINRDGFDVGVRIFSEQLRFNYPLGVLEGRNAVVDYLREFKSAFPDARFDVHTLIEEDQFVAARWTMTGTQTGAFKGRPATNCRTVLPGLTQFRLDASRIAEMWVAFNPNLLLG